ncbi:type 1 fimbrial protein [Klebsiella pneumoniae]|nr:type 1 fimbrial protein [Klebsiella pneumoniae]MTW92440.1 fimbrial protein [Klebsiella pneumoniae]
MITNKCFLTSFFCIYVNLAFADNVYLSFNGRLVSPPCSIDMVSSNLNPSLGNISVDDLSTAGAVSKEIPFQIKLNNCPSETSKVIVGFSGKNYPDNLSVFASNGTAQNVGVQLKQKDESWDSVSVRPGGTLTQYISKEDNSTTLNFITRAITQTGNVTPGTINTNITVTFIYQ